MISSAYKNLIEQCWCKIPYSRPTFDQITLEFKNNINIITESIDEDEFIKHVKYIDECESSFGKTKFNKLDCFFNRKKKSVDIKELDKRFLYDLKFFHLKEFIKLKDSESIQLVRNAETDPRSQFLLGRSLI